MQNNIKFKKFLCVFLTIAMVSSLTSFAAARPFDSITPDNAFSFSLTLDTIANSSAQNTQAIADRFGVDISKMKIDEILQRNVVLNLNITLGERGNGFVECFIEGELINGRESHSILSSGYLRSVVNLYGEEVLIGGITGFLDGVQIPENMITLTICLDVKTGEVYVPVAIGAFVDEENVSALLEFGTPFLNLGKAVRNVVSERAGENNTFVDTEAQEAQPMFNANEVGLAAQTGRLGSRDVIFGSHYGNRYAVPTGLFTARVRAQVHLNNFIASYNAALPVFNPNRPWQPFTSIDHLVVTVWTIFNTNNNHLTIQDNALPEAKENVLTFSASIEIPWGLVNLAPVILSTNIQLSGVRHTISNGERNVETRFWNNLQGLSSAVTSSSSPLNTNTGVASRYYFHNRMNLNQSANVSSYAAAEVFLVEVTGDGQFLPRWVTLATPWMSATINSRNP